MGLCVDDPWLHRGAAGTPVNVQRATELWVCAAMKGCQESMYSTAMCFLEGKGCIPKVSPHTHLCWHRGRCSASCGCCSDACQLLSVAFHVFVCAEVAPVGRCWHAEVPSAAPRHVVWMQEPAKARDLLEQLSAHGHGWSMFGLATLLMQEHNKAGGDPAEVARAGKLYIAAADKGVAPACKNVANMYELGLGLPKDLHLSLQWLTRAAKAGDPSAQVVLGRKLSQGDGVEKDEERGFAMFMLVRAPPRNPHLQAVRRLRCVPVCLCACFLLCVLSCGGC